MASRTNVVTGGVADYSIWRVILASAVGTMIEWYDFYIFGSLTAVLALSHAALPGMVQRGPVSDSQLCIIVRILKMVNALPFLPVRVCV